MKFENQINQLDKQTTWGKHGLKIDTNQIYDI